MDVPPDCILTFSEPLYIAQDPPSPSPSSKHHSNPNKPHPQPQPRNRVLPPITHSSARSDTGVYNEKDFSDSDDPQRIQGRIHKNTSTTPIDATTSSSVISGRDINAFVGSMSRNKKDRIRGGDCVDERKMGDSARYRKDTSKMGRVESKTAQPHHVRHPFGNPKSEAFYGGKPIGQYKQPLHRPSSSHPPNQTPVTHHQGKPIRTSSHLGNRSLPTASSSYKQQNGPSHPSSSRAPSIYARNNRTSRDEPLIRKDEAEQEAMRTMVSESSEASDEFQSDEERASSDDEMSVEDHPSPEYDNMARRDTDGFSGFGHRDERVERRGVNRGEFDEIAVHGESFESSEDNMARRDVNEYSDHQNDGIEQGSQGGPRRGKVNERSTCHFTASRDAHKHPRYDYARPKQRFNHQASMKKTSYHGVKLNEQIIAPQAQASAARYVPLDDDLGEEMMDTSTRRPIKPMPKKIKLHKAANKARNQAPAVEVPAATRPRSSRDSPAMATGSTSSESISKIKKSEQSQEPSVYEQLGKVFIEMARTSKNRALSMPDAEMVMKYLLGCDMISPLAIEKQEHVAETSAATSGIITPAGQQQPPSTADRKGPAVQIGLDKDLNLISPNVEMTRAGNTAADHNRNQELITSTMEIPSSLREGKVLVEQLGGSLLPVSTTQIKKAQKSIFAATDEDRISRIVASFDEILPSTPEKKLLVKKLGGRLVPESQADVIPNRISEIVASFKDRPPSTPEKISMSELGIAKPAALQEEGGQIRTAANEPIEFQDIMAGFNKQPPSTPEKRSLADQLGIRMSTSPRLETTQKAASGEISMQDIISSFSKRPPSTPEKQSLVDQLGLRMLFSPQLESTQIATSQPITFSDIIERLKQEAPSTPEKKSLADQLGFRMASSPQTDSAQCADDEQNSTHDLVTRWQKQPPPTPERKALISELEKNDPKLETLNIEMRAQGTQRSPSPPPLKTDACGCSSSVQLRALQDANKPKVIRRYDERSAFPWRVAAYKGSLASFEPARGPSSAGILFNSTATALYAPPIRAAIFELLDRESLKTCLSVNKAWYETGAPLAFKVACINTVLDCRRKLGADSSRHIRPMIRVLEKLQFDAEPYALRAYLHPEGSLQTLGFPSIETAEFGKAIHCDYSGTTLWNDREQRFLLFKVCIERRPRHRDHQKLLEDRSGKGWREEIFDENRHNPATFQSCRLEMDLQHLIFRSEDNKPACFVGDYDWSPADIISYSYNASPSRFDKLKTLIIRSAPITLSDLAGMTPYMFSLEVLDVLVKAKTKVSSVKGKEREERPNDDDDDDGRFDALLMKDCEQLVAYTIRWTDCKLVIPGEMVERIVEAHPRLEYLQGPFELFKMDDEMKQVNKMGTAKIIRFRMDDIGRFAEIGGFGAYTSIGRWGQAPIRHDKINKKYDKDKKNIRPMLLVLHLSSKPEMSPFQAATIMTTRYPQHWKLQMDICEQHCMEHEEVKGWWKEMMIAREGILDLVRGEAGWRVVKQ